MSPRDIYALLCKRNRCKRNAAVEALLPERVQGWGDVSSLDLSKTYVGPRGAGLVIELCKVLGDLKELKLADNYLNNDVIGQLCRMAQYHPSLSRLDLSDNDISWTAGMGLLELTAKNTMIQAVGLANTCVKPPVIDMINVQSRRNLTFHNRSSRRGPNPSNHPLAIRLRSLKRFFMDIARREGLRDDRIPKRYLIDGTKELWKLGGREEEVKQRAPEYFERLVQRSPAETLSWEMFLVLVAGEDVSYNSEIVTKLRFVFNAFDIDGAGYVEASDLGDLMGCLADGRQPSEEAVATKLAVFDLDVSMSIQWEEFLFMVYDLGPVMGLSLTPSAAPANAVKGL